MVTASLRPSIVWLRRNLRLEDNAVLKAALDRGGAVLPLFIWDADPSMGGASRWWLFHSLRDLQRDLRSRGSRLILRKGRALSVIGALIKETGAGAIFWDRGFEPRQREADEKVKNLCLGAGLFCDALNDALLFDPDLIRTGQGTPFKVFTPFWNHSLSLGDPPVPGRISRDLKAISQWPLSETPESLDLLPRGKWTSKFKPLWAPGARNALKALKKFLQEKLEDYPAARDLPAEAGTSKLSPYLHFGEIGVRRLWNEVKKHAAAERRPGMYKACEAFLRQILWREFAAGLLFHFPQTASRPLRREFERFAWRKDSRSFQAWQRGRTGYPIVDAGMRELWATGWMHNRVRMIAASFLVKDLLQPWQEGARWFMDTLVDADLANNTFGWQWVAGCGADAAPYFRIFNPVLQGEKFDPQGIYVRRWIPELSAVPPRYLHRPWEAPAEVLVKAGIRLGKDYPRPVVDHDEARKRALFAYHRLGR